MTFEETCEEIRQSQKEMMKKLASIEERVVEIVNENNYLFSRNLVLKHELSLLKKENETRTQDEDPLQDLIVILTKPDETQK